MDQIEKTRTDLDSLIKDALSAKYVGTSSIDEIKTGNSYQSVKIGEQILAGFRDRRESLFTRFDFHGKVVLDAGSNLGENSRWAATRGATMVYAIEYDTLFSLLSALICARNSQTNVFSINGDVSRYPFERMSLDVALAFSVWPYIHNRIDDLVSAGAGVFLLETHNVRDKSQLGEYLERLCPKYLFYSVLEVTDWGEGLEGTRFVVIFAKDWLLATEICQLSRHWVDYSALFGFGDLAAIQCLKDFDAGSGISRGLGDPRYWKKYLDGVREFTDLGRVESDNSYVRELARLLDQPDFDPNLIQEVPNMSHLTERVRRRFDDFLAISDGRLDHVSPVTLYVPFSNIVKALSSQSVDPDITRVAGSDRYWIDGYHRLFAYIYHGFSVFSTSIRFHFQETGFL